MVFVFITLPLAITSLQQLANKGALMIFTNAGLPNSCCVCGKPQKGNWYAENEDEARSGLGTCKKDSTYLPSAPKPKAKAAADPPAEKSEPSSKSVNAKA